MNAIIITDKDSKTKLSEALESEIVATLEARGVKTEVAELATKDASPCFGCLFCLTKHPGECVSKDRVNDLKKRAQKYTITIFVTPVIFGHFGSTIKNAIDRIGGSHELQVMIGYGEGIDDEERNTFIALTEKHRGSADVVHPGMDTEVEVYVTCGFQDNQRICEAFERYVESRRGS